MPSTHPHGALARLLAPAFAVAGLLVAAPSALAIPTSLPDPTWMADGPVYAIQPTTSGTTYIGGNFHYVGPRTGGGAVLDRDTVGTPPMTGWREVVGKVYAVVPDGVGGFYIGGSFTKVGGLAIKNLAHILPDRSVASSFHPNPNNTVRALALQSGVHRWLYVGGDFTSFSPTTGSTTRNRLAEIDTTTGGLSSWNPNLNHPVRALALSPTDSNVLFVGGDFDTVGPDTRDSLAAVDIDHSVGHAAFGRATSWDTLGTNASVNALTVNAAGDTVYAAGTFTCVGATDVLCTGGTGRNYVAAISTSTAGALSYNASIPKVSGYRVDALALSGDGSTLYAGGNFSDDLIATDATSGLHSSWDPNPGGPVESLAVTGSTIYAGGAFSDIGGQQRGRIAALRASDATAIENWNPGTNDPSGTSAVYALAVSDNPNDGSHEVYAGGDFTSTGGVPRDNLAALDQNGVPTAWNLGADSSVQALALSADEGTLYVGGVFTTLAGQTRNKLGALTTGTTATLTSWNPNVDPATGNVAALAIDGPDVYAGGSFTTVGGATHNRIAAIDATTGVVRSSFAASVDDEVYTLAVGRGTLYAGGLFLHAGLSNGTPRQRLAAFAETDGSLKTWNPAPDGAVRALAYSRGNAGSSDLLYVGGDFTTAGGQPRGRIAAISPTDGTATAWNPGADASVYAIAVAGPRIYVGGDFQNFTGTPSNQPKRLAALGTDSGASIGWTPDPDGTVNVLAVRGSTLYAGGSYKNVVTSASANSVTQQNYGTFTTIPTNTTIPSITGTLAVGQTLTCDKGLWTGMVAGTGYTYEWRTPGGPIAGQTATTYTVGSDDGGAAISCRVTATNTDGATTADSLAVSIPGPPANTTAPQISGTTVAGGTGTALTCSQGSWTGTVSPPYLTTWKRDGLAVDTGSTHTVVSADLNHVLTCAVTASGPGGSRTTASSGRTVPSVPQVSSLPTLSGTTTVGSFVTCGPGAWNGSPSYTYSWLRGAQVVGGSAQYQIAAADAVQQLRCRVTAANESGVGQADSALVSVIAVPANAVAPAIAGEARVGRQLACSPGTWTGSATFTYAYQWLRDGLPIGGAASTSYTNAAVDGGHSISCRVTASNAAGSVSVASAADSVPAVPGATSAPQISGAGNVGETLTCSPGTWVNAASLAVAWRRNGTAIPGATATTYKLTSADSGAAVSCRVTATNGAETATSDATAVFVNGATGGAGGANGGAGGTGGANPSTGPKPSVTTAAVKVVAGAGKLGLGCAKGTACSGTATMTSGKVKLATLRFALKAGSKKSLTFHLTAAGKKLLRQKHVLHVTLTVAVKTVKGTTRTTRTITLRG